MRISKTQQASNKRLILQAAVDLMTPQGVDARTMKQIARAAGVGDATIYKYFPSKERRRLLMDSRLERLLPGRDLLKLARRGVAGAAR